MFIKLLTALIVVESGGNPKAYSSHEGAVGILQIRQICLTDVNIRYNTSLELGDCYNPTVARWVCVHYLKMYNASSYEEAARIWNGGPKGMQKKATFRYWIKVKRELSKTEGDN